VRDQTGVFSHRMLCLDGVGPHDRLLAPGARPPLAAHLVSPRLGFIHHGLYVGAGRVVHYSSFSGHVCWGPVEEVCIERFAAGRQVWVRGSAPVRFAPEEVVRRARSRVGEDCYRLLSNNCEHLCEWCLRGESRSHQADRLRAWLAWPRRALLRLSVRETA
jgi:hypothetical protein